MFQIEMEFVRGILFVRLEGVLSSRTSEELRCALDRMIHDEGIRYFVINLESLDYMDDVGLQSIMNHYFDIVLHDGKLVVCGSDDHVKIKANTKLIENFKMIESGQNELEACRLIHI